MSLTTLSTAGDLGADRPRNHLACALPRGHLANLVEVISASVNFAPKAAGWPGRGPIPCAFHKHWILGRDALVRDAVAGVPRSRQHPASVEYSGRWSTSTANALTTQG